MNSNTDREHSEHSLTLISRRELKLTGIKQILNFNDSNVAFVSTDGELEIDGDSINIDSLDLDRGVATVTGKISGITYINEQPIKKRRLFGGI